jgi:hypothetical protein
LRVVADEGDDIRHEGALTVEGDLTATNGYVPSNELVLNNSARTSGQIFDLLSQFVPNVGDKRVLNGAWAKYETGASGAADLFIASFFEKTSSTTINVQYLLMDPSANPGSSAFTATDGDSVVFGYHFNWAW